MKCNHNYSITELKWSVIPLKNGGKHVKVVCPECNVFIKFLNEKEKEILRNHIRNENMDKERN